MVINRFAKTVLAVLIGLSLLSEQAHSEEGDSSPTDDVKTSGDVYAGGKVFQSEKDQGWFWKKDPPPPVQEVKQEPKPQVEQEDKSKKDDIKVAEAPPATGGSHKGKQVKSFSVEWFNENIQKLRNRAIDSPTQENVRAYLLAQRIMLDKAQRFKDVMQLVSITDPLIDETGRRSTSSFGSLSQSVTAEDNTRIVAKDISKKAGIFFFFKGEDCPLCAKQASIMQMFGYMTGIPVVPISVDGNDLPGSPFPNVQRDTGQAKKLHIQNVPALALGIPPKTSRIVSFGPISAEQLIKRTVFIAHDAGIISDEQYKSTLPFNDNGYIDAGTMQDMPQDFMDNPDNFIKYIQKKAGYASDDVNTNTETGYGDSE